ncbi:Holliday junction resolvase RuvX [Patescibacteria group bacterium]
MTKKILGIDYGQSRVGIAIADSKIADPLRTVPADKSIKTIIKLIESHDISDIVVGVSEGETLENTKRYIEELEGEINLPIHTQDETLSSYEVKEKLLITNKKKIKGSIDHFAAALILQDYIDENNIF